MMRAEGSAGSVAGARWAAMRELEKQHPDVDPDRVRFETLEEGESGVTVAAIVEAEAEAPVEAEVDVEETVEELIDEDLAEESEQEDEQDEQEELEAEEEVEGPEEPEEPDGPEGPEDDAEEEDEQESKRPRARRERSASSDEWPDRPDQRARRIVERVLEAFDLDGEIAVEESEEELVVTVEGDDLGLLIGKHGRTIDAIQMVCSQACYRGSEARKRVVLDAAGYREQRAEALHRQADRAAADAVDYGRPVELDSMTASERRVVHNYLKDQPDVETHSEGDEPYRRIVVTPTSGELRYD